MSKQISTDFRPTTNMVSAVQRVADHEIEPLILNRWSPRAMTGETLDEEELNRLFEAARWAPSTYNEQEWRFLYASNDSPWWPAFFDLLTEGNQAWCVHAAALVVVLSHKIFEMNGKPNKVHTFDAGLATQNLFLQASSMGIVAHGMAGFDNQAAREKLEVPDDYAVEAMIALGRPGPIDQLPPELREREFPSDRRPIQSFVRCGKFDF